MSNWVVMAGSTDSIEKKSLMDAVAEWVKVSLALRVGKFENDGETFYVALMNGDNGVDFETEDKFVEFLMEFDTDGYVWVTDNEPFEDARFEWVHTEVGEIYGQVKAQYRKRKNVF